jgi:hypothetical protein
MVPFIKKNTTEAGDQKSALLAFALPPVFRLEDTSGETLDWDYRELSFSS